MYSVSKLNENGSFTGDWIHARVISTFPCCSISITDRDGRKHTFVYIGFVHVIASGNYENR